MTQHLKEYLHFGCGPIFGPSWHNIDGDRHILIGFLWRQQGWTDPSGNWKVWFGRVPLLRRLFSILLLEYSVKFRSGQLPLQICDLTRPLPFPDRVFRAAYGSHVLEHLYRNEALQLLREISRVLLPGGILRVVVPDLEVIVRAYEEAKADDVLAADTFNERLLMRSKYRRRRNAIRALVMGGNDFHLHKWMYDKRSLTALVEEAGYKDICERTFLDSSIPVIHEVETPDRLLNGAGVCVEAIR